MEFLILSYSSRTPPPPSKTITTQRAPLKKTTTMEMEIVAFAESLLCGNENEKIVTLNAIYGEMGGKNKLSFGQNFIRIWVESQPGVFYFNASHIIGSPCLLSINIQPHCSHSLAIFSFILGDWALSERASLGIIFLFVCLLAEHFGASPFGVWSSHKDLVVCSSKEAWRVSRQVFPLTPAEEQAVRGVRRKLDAESSPSDSCAFKRIRDAQLHPSAFERSFVAVGPICSQIGDGMDMS
ncbi:hypothetical protein LOK49_LG01G01837 [Camellia lanceoleosa]|uniref:Uncharacterized protein n=1 Tax=Camellia lanceoleosa TaxID=1840588 RepID=A0ACC0IYT6_9ERIC|nr:hypothetical protein LOK49_LG01G01837 [Camellia lanceoleosa]